MPDDKPPIISYRTPDKNVRRGSALVVRIVAGIAAGGFAIFAAYLVHENALAHDKPYLGAVLVSLMGVAFCAVTAAGLIGRRK